jgi:hypothetical protein
MELQRGVPLDVTACKGWSWILLAGYPMPDMQWDGRGAICRSGGRAEMKTEKISIKLTTHNMDHDIHIMNAINHLLGYPSMVRVCIHRLKSDFMFPIPYKLTVWYVNRMDWTPSMFLAERLGGTGIDIQELSQQQRG